MSNSRESAVAFMVQTKKIPVKDYLLKGKVF